MKHIQQYLVPGIELIAMNPKLSIAIVGHEALESEAAMREAAVGVALMAGRLNQTACSNARRRLRRVRHRRRGDLERLEALGREIHDDLRAAARVRVDGAEGAGARTSRTSCRPSSLDEDFYRVIGDASSAGVVVSRTEDPVEFADQLSNRVVNLVPVADIAQGRRAGERGDADRRRLPGVAARRGCATRLALGGVQHIRALRTSLDGLTVDDGSHTLSLPARRWRADAAHGPLDDRPELKPSCAC